MESSPSIQQKPASTTRAPRASAQELVFVTVAHPNDMKDRNTQRKISRHVMKDIGRSRRRKPQKYQLLLNSTPEKPPSPESREVVATQLDKHIQQTSNFQTLQSSQLALPQSSSGIFSLPDSDRAFLSPPVSARARRLISFLNRDDSSICRVFRIICFTVAMADDGAMYMALAESALYTGQDTQDSLIQENSHSLEHYTASLGLLNGRLRNRTSSIGEAIIGMMIFLSGYDLRVRNFMRWSIHMDGLQRIIELRGGLYTLKSYHLRMFLIWSDMVGSMSLDIPPRFPLHGCIMSPLHEYPVSPVLAGTLSALQDRCPTLWDICPLLESLSGLTQLASKSLPCNWYKDSNLTQNFGLLVHSMLNLQRHEIPADQNNPMAAGLTMREIIRLASLLFLTAPVNYLAANRDLHSYHGDRLQSLLASKALDWSGLEDLELWVLVISILTVNNEDHMGTVSRINAIMSMNGLDWKGVLQKLRQIAWMDSVFSNEVKILKTRLN